MKALFESTAPPPAYRIDAIDRVIDPRSAADYHRRRAAFLAAGAAAGEARLFFGAPSATVAAVLASGFHFESLFGAAARGETAAFARAAGSVVPLCEGWADSDEPRRRVILFDVLALQVSSPSPPPVHFSP